MALATRYASSPKLMNHRTNPLKEMTIMEMAATPPAIKVAAKG